MKVLQISNYFYPHIGGTEQVARDVLNCLKQDEEIIQKVICFNEDAIDNNIINNRNQTIKETIDDIEITRCSCITKIFSQSISLSYIKELKEILNDFNPDVIIFHYPNPLVSTLLLRLIKKQTKLITYWHLDITKQKYLGKLFEKQNYKLLERSNKIICTSPNYLEGSKYLSKYKDKCIIICNPINLNRLKINNKTYNLINELRNKYKDKIVVFTCSRHIPYKGLTYLIKASKLLSDEYVILIGGNGPLTNELMKEAKDDHKVIFLGRLSNEELIAYYNICDIYAFPSITKNEAFGISQIEAMSFKKPIVNFKIDGSGVNYVSINNITGIEVDNRDYEAFSKAIDNLGHNTVLRICMGDKGKERVDELFTIETFNKAILELIGGLK